MRIGLIPLDERPVNTRYPRMIADIAGVELVLPPTDVLGNLRVSANTAVLADWVREQAPHLDTLIVSVEMLGFGGLIPSRITDESTLAIMDRLNLLRELRHSQPDLTIYAFNVITRIPNADNNIEEPLYWGEYGTRLHQFSRLWHQVREETVLEPTLHTTAQTIPDEHREDFLRRRLRNHQINLHMLEMAADGVLDLLVISSDDTSRYSMGTQEKYWLHEWVMRVINRDERVLMYPGADEIGCALLARAISPRPTRFYVHYAEPAEKDRTAPYEDGPVSRTVERQLVAVGGEIVDDPGSADLILAVNTPSVIDREFDPDQAEAERTRREPFLRDFVAWVNQQAQGTVIIADVAYPNGSDPVLIEQLLSETALNSLAGYGAWNTAGNTIGTALAQGIATYYAAHDSKNRAHDLFLTHRFLEDWGYQHRVREAVRDWLFAQTGIRDTNTDLLEATRQRIETALAEHLTQLPVLGDVYGIVPGSVRLPWNRTFEVDFDLEIKHS